VAISRLLRSLESLAMTSVSIRSSLEKTELLLEFD